MKSNRIIQFGFVTLLMACVGVAGCVASTLATPKGELRSQGTIVAVHSADRTIEIKTDLDESRIVSVVASTKLWQRGKHFTFDQMEAGKYVVIQYSMCPDGRFIAFRVIMYNDKSKVSEPYPE